MALRRTLALASFVGVLGLPIFLTPVTHSAQPDATACTVTISGAEAPNMLPAHAVWEATFKRQPESANAIELPADRRARLNARAAAALEKVVALRATVSPGPVNPKQALLDREQVIADTIVDARDDVMREVSEDDFDILSDFAQATARGLRITVPAPGRLVTSADGVSTCEVAVLGEEYPFLVPEYQSWAAQFNGWAGVAAQNRGSDGRITDEYLTIVRRSSIRASPEDVRTFLEFATKAAAEVAAVRKELPGAEAEQVLAHEFRVQRAVMKGRHHVMRAVSVEGWRAIVQWVEASRVGAKVWFRSRPAN